ncbi:sarcosine oxidase alpha subunit [alpha proteobacterium U9-1i]|nr:sarcosine oxidase alpha subunit [alpha proteobacterium U9-1i]
MRLPKGGRLIDRQRPLSFSFEGQQLQGYVGDTLASALLASGKSVVGRSFKYHRPRGIFAAGVEEPNALMQVGEGGRADANLVATQIALHDGLSARAVNCWPSAAFDLGAINNALARFFPAGFYYKTFLWPNWRVYEPVIRRAAGLGKASEQPDADAYETRFAHCDVLVVGGGPAGISAALTAQSSGARVMLVEQDARLGGSLRWRGGEIDDAPSETWLSHVEATLQAGSRTKLLKRTMAVGYFDHNSVALLQSFDVQAGQCAASARMRLWQVRAKRVILASGAIERPLVFPGNDRPGVMLASAVARYIGDYGVRCGEAALFLANNDSAYASAQAYRMAGGNIKAIVDTRADPGVEAARLAAEGVEVIAGGTVVMTKGAKRISAARVRTASGAELELRIDLLAVSGGWTPTIHLHCQSGGLPKWDDRFACLVPGPSVQNETSVGASAGVFSLGEAMKQGARAGADAAQAAGYNCDSATPAPQARSTISFAIEPVWMMEGKGKAFVDLQNDVTAGDIELAHRENFVSVEHLKRYTTLGMGTDQGKTSNVNALALMGQMRGSPPAQSGVTRYRFPFAPLPIGALNGFDRSETLRPSRRLPLHDWHTGAGAVFEEYGSWMRPARYPRGGETRFDAEQREARTVREAVGIFDGSPLGKIEVLGPDAGRFLDRIYANRMSDLAVGRCRYGLMLNELGVVIDDGVASRLDENRFLVGTTSAGAARIAAWLEEWLQCEWTSLNVLVAPVTHCWGVVTVTGPKARETMARVGVNFDIGPEGFKHLSWREGEVGGVSARVFRVSYTGEVSYEINVAPSRISEVWRSCFEAGKELGIAPVGIDAWDVLRTERGFLHVGSDTDGTTSALDAGWGRVLKRKDDFVGRRSLMRPDDQRANRLNFVGIEPVSPDAPIRVGLPVIAKAAAKRSDGYITSACFSPTLGRYVGLGMIEDGRARIGETIALAADGAQIIAKITVPGAFDPKGERVHG